MNKKIVLISIMLVMLALFSLNTVNACDDSDNEVFYDCSIWSPDDTMVNLGVNSWPLLDGSAKVSAYKFQNCLSCESCTCCYDCSDSYECCVDCKCFIKQGILTHRGTRGLGVYGGSNNDEIDVICGNEAIIIVFNEPQTLNSFEVRSLFNESYQGKQVNEECDVIILLDHTIVQKYHLVGKELIGTGNGIVCVSDINICFDRIIFFVARGQTYSLYSDFAVAKIKTSNNEISFVQPSSGIVCDNDVNQPPVANDDYVNILENSIDYPIYALENDYDPDGDPIQLMPLEAASEEGIYNNPEHGTLVAHLFYGAGTDYFTYTPDHDYIGEDYFIYRIIDMHGHISTGSVFITVDYQNHPPVANDDSYTVYEGGKLTVIDCDGVLKNDYDDDCDGLIAIKLSEPYNGVLIFNSDGSFEYTPNEDFSGVDSFTYKVNDGKEDSNIATVKITVEDVVPSIIVRKTSNPSVVVEPGADVVFTIEICNTGVEPVTLVSLVDNVFGDLNGVGTCVLPQTIPAGGSYICNFTTMISGEAGDFHCNNVTAIVKDNEGNIVSNYDWELVFIVEYEGGSLPPVATTNGPYEGKVGQTIVFNGSKSYDLDGMIVNYTWDFGDGTPLGYGVEVSHVYTTAGTYTVTLTVIDDDNATNSSSTTATITEENNNHGGNDEQTTTTSGGTTTKKPSTGSIPNQPPVANAGGPYECFLGEEITFIGLLSTDDKSIVSYEWDFGDGTTGSGVIAKHKYLLPGEYTVTLTVKDVEGETNDAEAKAVVINRSPSSPTVIPDKNLTEKADIYIGIINKEYTFIINATDPDGGNIRYIVDWGDGTINQTDMFPSGTIISLKHKWNSTGTCMINVTAVDENGDSSEKVSLQLKINEKEDEPKEINFIALWLLLLTLLAVWLILILLLRRKRKKDKAEQ